METQGDKKLRLELKCLLIQQMLKSFTLLNLLADLPPVVYNPVGFKRGRDYLCLAVIMTNN